MIAFTCVSCGLSFQADESLAGRRTRCKRCGAITRVPVPELPAVAAVALPPRTPAAPELAPEPESPRRPATRKRKRKKRRDERDAWVSLAIGAGIAAVALAVPLIGMVPNVLLIVIHEMGHCAAAWLFGSVAIPSFDLTFGGGISHTFARQPILLGAVYAAFAFLLYRARDHRPTLIVLAILVAAHAVATFSPLRDLLITAMGHGMELLIAGVFFYRVLSGNQILRNEERPLYASLGLYIVLYDVRFAYQLITSREHREAYGDAKGGGHWMDFSLIADEHLHVRLEVVAVLFLIACALPLLGAFLAHRYWRRSG